MRAKFVKHITSTSESDTYTSDQKKQFVETRLEQLYQLLCVKCEVESSQLKKQAKKKKIYTYSIEEHMWNQISKLTTNSFYVNNVW